MASRTVLLERNFIHCRKIGAFVPDQSEEFFLPEPDPRLPQAKSELAKKSLTLPGSQVHIPVVAHVCG
jgi:hypothetical protein